MVLAPIPSGDGGTLMELRKTLIGTVVRVKEGYRKPELEGMVGIIEQVWGAPNYTALDVRLEGGRSELFWLHQLEVAEAGALLGWDSESIAYYDGS